MFNKFDEQCMQEALAQARLAEQAGEVPVGAVIALNGEIIAKAHNHPIALNDPTGHAEILALRQAAQKLDNYRLPSATMYVTLEPCAMCAGALVHARIERLVYAADDPKTGAAKSVFSIACTDQLNHQIHCESGLMADESRNLLQAFFKARR